jgi:hypothetical protein
MVTPVVWPSRHKRLLSLGWPVDGASCQASANYACEYVIISQALFNHTYAKKASTCLALDYATFECILEHFSSTFQSHLCKQGRVHAFLLTMQLCIYSEAFLDLF